MEIGEPGCHGHHAACPVGVEFGLVSAIVILQSLSLMELIVSEDTSSEIIATVNPALVSKMH